MAEYRVVKLKCTKCGRMVNNGKDACACSKPNRNIERLEVIFKSSSRNQVIKVSPQL